MRTQFAVPVVAALPDQHIIVRLGVGWYVYTRLLIVVVIEHGSKPDE